MSRPTRSRSMAHCAESALLAAVEIYNKPTVEYREQTFAILIVNSWEVLLKARLVQLDGNRLRAIYQRQNDGRKYRRNRDGEILSITIESALGAVNVPRDVRGNILGLVAIRNEAAHMGLLHSNTRERVLQYGTAAVQNFVMLFEQWFGDTVRVPYLLPLGLLGAVNTTTRSPNQKQKQLLMRLDQIAESYSEIDSSFSVVMTVEMNINPKLSGGATIGLTNDPSAMTMRVSDDQIADYFTATFADIVELCRARYPNFKQNRRFYKVLEKVKADARCSFHRKLNPADPASQGKYLYHPGATLERFDDEFSA